MRLLDRFLNRSAQNVEPKPADKRIANPTADFIRKVWESPATYNRHTRRAVGILSKVWRWDLNISDDTHRTFVPRYIRRHYERVRSVATAARVPRRRERKERARIMRASRKAGLL